MEKRLAVTGWGMFGAFVCSFIIFAITKIVVIAVAGDIFLIVAIIAGIRNHVRAHHG